MEMVTIPKAEYEELKRKAEKDRPLLEDLKEAFDRAEKEGIIWK